MNPWTARPILLMLVAAAACSGAPSQPQTQTTPAAAPARVAEHAPRSEAIARADALLEDLRRRQAAQAKFDRENPARAAVPISATLPAVRPTPTNATVAAPSTTDAPAAQPSPDGGAAAGPARDASWWKEQMRTLQLALDQASAKLAEAEKENYKYAYEDLQAEYKRRLAAVAGARRAIEQLHDDARRTGVPPGWLRLP